MNERENIEKLAIEHGITITPNGYSGETDLLNVETAEAFAKALQASEPVGYIDEFGNFENSLKQWMAEEPNVIWAPLYTTPQPAPDTVPRAEYDKLLDALKYYADKKNWSQDSQDLGMEVRYYNVMYGDMYDHNDVTKYGGMRARQAIAEAEGKRDRLTNDRVGTPTVR